MERDRGRESDKEKKGRDKNREGGRESEKKNQVYDLINQKWPTYISLYIIF